MRVKIIVTLLFSLISYGTLFSQNIGGYGKVTVHRYGRLSIFGDYAFNSNGHIECYKYDSIYSRIGVVGFENETGWAGASDSVFVDGYVWTKTDSSFIYPVGDNNNYRPIALHPSKGTSIAYVNRDVYAKRVGASSFSQTQISTEIKKIDSLGFWIIGDSDDSSVLTLTWDSTSSINALVDSTLSNLTIVGWNRDSMRWEGISSSVVSSVIVNNHEVTYSDPSSLKIGAIQTDSLIDLNQYTGFTFGVLNSAQSCFHLSVFLQGAQYLANDELMIDSLRSKGLIPFEEPYTGLPQFNHIGGGGGETVDSSRLLVTGSDAIVDWIFLEFRGAIDSSQVLQTKSALLTRNGKVFTPNNEQAKVCLDTLITNQCFIAVRHRNHLGVMTAEHYNLESEDLIVNFDSISTFGTNSLSYVIKANLDTSQHLGLRGGNVNQDGSTIYDNANSDDDLVLNTVLNAPLNIFNSQGYIYRNQYNVSDINLDGDVIYDNSTSDSDIIINTVLNHPDNIFNSFGFINTKENLP